MSKEAGRYCRKAIGVLCSLSLVWTVTVAAPQGVPASAGWGDFPQSAADAARFLDYSTWGPTSAAIVHLGEVGYSRFLDEQFEAPMSSYQDFAIVPNTRPADCIDACQRDNYTLYPIQTRFYTNALYGSDQLRQRVAFALHQIFVVSGTDITIPGRFAPYLKILDRNAFGNYRQLLQEITLNPAMGNYLDMAGNLAANPNENYAREVLQLFSIGLNQLNQDGTPMLGADGQPVPAYDQDDVNAFSRVFTGWNFATSPQPGVVTNYFVPMTATQSRHDVGSKTLLQGVTLSPNQTAAKDLSDALDNIFQHPNVGPFICRQLIQHLVTSNPSPAYVRRVAEVFANNGANVRGDLRAVVRAILLDDEAHANPPDSSKGHLKHPVLFVTNLLRAIGARSADGNGLSDGYLNPQSQGMGMDLFVPPSVFSYFSPATGVPGSNLRGPEFGTLNTSTAIRRANFVNTMVFSRINVSTFAPTGTSLDFPALQALASTPEELVLMLNTLMMGGRMSQPMYDTILAAVKAVPSNNPLRRAQTAVYLIATSAQYQVAR